MALLLFILLLLRGVSSSEDSGARTTSVTESTNLTDLKPLKITRHFEPCSPSLSICVLKCSTQGVQKANLTWYKENQVCSQLSVFKFDPNPSLQLSVDHQDKNIRCVLNSSISNQTESANIPQLCQTCPDTPQTAVPVKEGGDVTLHTDLKDITGKDIRWMFGPEEDLIAEINDKTSSQYYCDDERFKNRLQLNSQTGDLTITNTIKNHSGIYKLYVANESLMCLSYNVTVIELLPSPQISNHSNHCPSSGSKCALECLVFNVTNGNLAWYRGNSSVSSISVRDGNYLCLYLNNTQDKGNYSCVVSNSIMNETKYLNISELCSGQSNNYKLIWLVVVALGALGVGCYCYKRKRQGRVRLLT